MSYLEKRRSDLRKALRELWVEREMERNRVTSRPIMSEQDESERLYLLANIDRHYDGPISLYTRQLIEAELAEERDGVVYLNPVRDEQQVSEILSRV